MKHNHSAAKRFAWTAALRRSLMTLCAGAAIFFTAGSASALDILIASSGSNTELVAWLQGMGHTVTVDSGATPPEDGDYDLIMFTRQTTSGNFGPPNNAVYNALGTAQISVGWWTMRSSRGGWVSSDSRPNYAGAYDAYPNLSHPFLAGLTAADTNVYVNTSLVAETIPVGSLLPGTVQVATYNTSMNAQIFEIPLGTTFANGAGASGGKRYVFLYDKQSDGSSFTNLNTVGLTILSNMIAASQSDPDFDMDGMPDAWEQLYTNTNWQVSDGGLDLDGDGLNHTNEYAAKSSPDDPDSDGDTILDGPEFFGTANPYGNPTNPILADSDGDGIDDPVEISGALNTGWGNTPTDPANEDTDGDVMWDKYEIENNLIPPGLNPTNAADGGVLGTADLDGDGLYNQEEFTGELNQGAQTRADNADTDGDNYDDFSEDNTGNWSSTFFTGTNPTNDDTDADGLIDGDENQSLDIFQGAGVTPAWCNPNDDDTDDDTIIDGDEVTIYGSDPQNDDSDGDGATDGLEVTFGTDPTNSASFPTPEQLAELRLNFAQVGDPTPAGWTNYVAAHEDPTTFTAQVFAAFFETDIVVEPVFTNPDSSPSTNDASFQMFDRSNLANAAAAGNQDLYRNWLSADDRTEGSQMSLVVSNLPAGAYTWISEHFDPHDRTEDIDLVVHDANGTHITVARKTASGNAAQSPDISRFTALVVADGVNPVTIEFIGGPWTPINAVELKTTAPLPSDDPQVIDWVANPAGDSTVTFSPGGHGYTLGTSSDLLTGFLRDLGVVYDMTNTFTIPAGSTTDDQGFFGVERLPQTP